MPRDAAVSGPDPSQLLTVAEVAGLLQISPERVYWLCSRGIISSVKLGTRTRRIRRADLDSYIEDCAA
jgi:excisionase family DNA binding protein